MKQLNLPNKITLARIALIPIVVILYFVNFPYHEIAACIVFMLCCSTDFIDGNIARKRNLVTDLGKFLDPIADKVIVVIMLFVFVGDGTQVCASLGFITTKLGMHFVHYGPEGHQLNAGHKKILEANCKLSGGTWAVTDERDAVRGADFIYTDVWYGLYENEMPKDERVRVFADFQVNRELMQLGALGCKFLHCLPATRGEDVTDEVADSAASLCWEQAGNRLTAMRGLLVYFTRCRRSPSELALAAAREELDTFLAARLGGC